jgi:hypothetical protein
MTLGTESTDQTITRRDDNRAGFAMRKERCQFQIGIVDIVVQDQSRTVVGWLCEKQEAILKRFLGMLRP